MKRKSRRLVVEALGARIVPSGDIDIPPPAEAPGDVANIYQPPPDYTAYEAISPQPIWPVQFWPGF